VSPVFLSVDEVLFLHSEQLAIFGGGSGVRDRGLLESALAQPEASFGGEYVHGDLYLMAAAYLFHIVKNHPFVDGNKRAGALSALVFLESNGIPIKARPGELYELTIAVAEGSLTDKAEIAARLKAFAAR